MIFCKSEMKSGSVYFLLITFIVLFTSCADVRQQDTASQIVYPTVTRTTIKKTTPVLMGTVNSNEEITKTEELPSSQTSRTPPPTLLPEEAKIADIKMLELYETNGNCKLPCWWGIVPGETNWVTAKSLLNTLTNHIVILSKESETDSSYIADVYLFSGESNYYRNQMYVIQDDIVEKINVQVGPIAYPNYTLAAILDSYGSPNEIWVSSYGYSIEGETPFTIILYYQEPVMLLKYYVNASIIEIEDSSFVKGCIQDKSVSSMGLWAPDVHLNFSDSVNETSGMRPSEGYLYRPLEEVTDMTVETFYQTYLDQNTEVCIETPAEIWVNDH